MIDKERLQKILNNNHKCFSTENLILNKAAKIVCATQNYYESSKILSKYENKISLIPYGIKKNQNTQNIISNKIKVLVKELRQKKIIISVGRLIEYKGFDKLVEVGNFLSEDCFILIVGNGPLENSLSQKIIKNKYTELQQVQQ